VGATSCHACSVNAINLPTPLYCITYWLADNLGTLFLRSDSASSSTATPPTSASTTPVLKRFKFLPEKLQQSGSTDDRSQGSSSSTCATMHAKVDQYLHELLASMPEEDAISFWRRRQAAYSLLAPLAQDLVAAPASRVEVLEDMALASRPANSVLGFGLES